MKNNKRLKFSPLIFFLVAILLITYFAPRESSFKYSYVEGKPWRYALLTAPFDFPIYKPEAQVNQEKDSILSQRQYYYKSDPTVLNKVKEQLDKDAAQRNTPDEYISYVKRELDDIYKVGVILVEDYDKIKATSSQQLMLIPENDNMAQAYSLSSIYTSKEAYQKILNELPSYLNASVIRSLGLNDYLTNNIIYDEEWSEKNKAELMQKVVFAQGMVQTGERIIDRGEIVDKRTYNILKSFEKVSEEKGGETSSHNFQIVGQFVLISIFMFSFMVYLLFFRPREYTNRKNLIFMLLTITSFCIITGITSEYKLMNIYIIPFAIPTILIRTFIDSRTAMTSHMIMILICSLMVPFPLEFILLQIPAGFMCIFGLKDLSERSQLMRCSFFILLAYIVVYVGFVLWQEGDVRQVNWRMFLYFGINFIIVMFSYLLVYMCERVFGFISGVSMIELSNINKPLLQKLSEVAPGTFQHSMQVANLASAAALKIGANASLVRTGALYHDVGKMSNPAYFTENQTPGSNPHKGLDYKESARIIIDHVNEGEKIAKSNQLPSQIIDFIRTHHGKGKARFFYNSYKNEHPDEEVDEALFTYPGPNPFSKETGILMMADTVEAASRSLPEYTDETISTLVNKLIDAQVSEGLLKNTPLTFQDIEMIKDVFCEKLKTIYHTRISYPELKEDAE